MISPDVINSRNVHVERQQRDNFSHSAAFFMLNWKYVNVILELVILTMFKGGVSAW